MADPTKTDPIQLRKIAPIFLQEDWGNPAFSYGKAYVCSVFSEWAYSEITQFDLDHAELERFSIFNASTLYEHLISSQRKNYFQGFIQEQSSGEERAAPRPQMLAIEYDESWVIIAFKLKINRQDVIFIAIRGTHVCARNIITDLRADLSIAHIRPFDHPNDECAIHRGFYDGVIARFEKLIKAIEKSSKVN
jgi:hypothetical protein